MEIIPTKTRFYVPDTDLTRCSDLYSAVVGNPVKMTYIDVIFVFVFLKLVILKVYSPYFNFIEKSHCQYKDLYLSLGL